MRLRVRMLVCMFPRGAQAGDVPMPHCGRQRWRGCPWPSSGHDAWFNCLASLRRTGYSTATGVEASQVGDGYDFMVNNRVMRIASDIVDTVADVVVVAVAAVIAVAITTPSCCFSSSGYLGPPGSSTSYILSL